MKKFILLSLSTILTLSTAITCLAQFNRKNIPVENHQMAKVVSIDGENITLQLSNFEPDDKNKKGEKPDFSNLSEKELAELEKNKPQKPDFSNLSDEELAELEKNKPQRPEISFDGDTITLNASNLVKTVAKPENEELENKEDKNKENKNLNLEENLVSSEVSVGNVVNLIYDDNNNIKYIITMPEKPEKTDATN